MTTKKQHLANIRNAQKSTGPRTVEGRRRSSQNATEHGLRSQTPVIHGESATELAELHDELVRGFAPRDALETLLIHHLADAEWRHRRFLRYESALYCYNDSTARPPPEHLITQPAQTEAEKQLLRDGAAIARMAGGTDSLNSISRYDAATRRDFFQTFQTLANCRLQNPFHRPAKPAADSQKTTSPNEPIYADLPNKSATSEHQIDPTRATVPAQSAESILLPAKGGPPRPK